MSGIPIDAIVEWLGQSGHLVDRPVVIGAPLAQEVTGACVDSRLVRPGNLFVALPGERVDGHDYVDQAVQGGAVCALVAAGRLSAVRRSVFGSVRLLPVDDTLAALQSLGLRWRRQFAGLTRIGVTGSNGKTTTKELLASMLSIAAPTVASHGNYNSDIGLPVELLKIRDSHRYGVFELGMNRVGEIRLLAGLLDPDIALITNIGHAHIGMVGSQDAIAREKRAIFSLFSGGQTAVIPAADRYADVLAADVAGTVIRYDMQTAGVQRVVSNGINGSTLHCSEGKIELRLPGPPMVTNVIGAITVARELGIPFNAIRDGVERVRPVFGRSEVLQGAVTVIRDCYNANPESTRSALDLLAASSSTGRRVAIVGAMKELGEYAEEAHRDVAEYALSRALDMVWFVGDEFASIANGSLGADARVFADSEWDDLVHAAGQLCAGDVVLLKGSRAIALERLTPVLLGGESPA